MSEAIQAFSEIVSKLAGGMHRLAAGSNPPETASGEAIDLHRLAYRLARISLITAACLIGFSIYRVAAMSPFLALLAVLAIGRKAIRKPVLLTAHGTARWADWWEIPQGRGLMIGMTEGKRPRRILPLFKPQVPSQAAAESLLGVKQRQLITPEAVHWTCFSPTGAGKGVSLIIPHLLTCPDSCVVIDFKGENALITARASREGVRSQNCHPRPVRNYYHMNKLNRPSDTFNSVDCIDANSRLMLDEVQGAGIGAGRHQRRGERTALEPIGGGDRSDHDHGRRAVGTAGASLAPWRVRPDFRSGQDESDHRDNAEVQALRGHDVAARRKAHAFSGG